MGSLKRLNRFFWKYRYRLLLGILFTIISNIFAIYPARLVRESVDVVVENLHLFRLFSGSELLEVGRSRLLLLLLGFAGLIFLMALLKGLFLFMVRQTIIVTSRLMEYDMKNQIYAQYQALDYGFYKRNATGDLMNRISEDVSRVRMYLGPALMYGINLLVLFVLIIGTMLSVSPTLTLYVLIPLPLLSLAVYLVNSAILKRSEVVQAQLSTISSFVQEAFSGIRVLKNYGRESIYGGMFEEGAETYRRRNLDLVKLNAFFFPLIMMLIGLSTLLTVYIGGVEVSQGGISAGVIAEFIIYVNMLTWPVASLGWITSIIQRAAASQKRINEFLDTQPAIVSPGGEPRILTGELEFRKVSFTYPDTGIQALNEVSFQLKPGETLAIAGRTGSGKTTLAQLVMRFFDPESGTIRVDGIDLKNWPLESYREAIGYVPQEVFLFSDSIAQNIQFGLHRSNASEDELWKRMEQSAEQAAIHDSIIEFAKGYQTRLGERGITLSGGQKQRISIARAIIKEPALLIFDDCLSAVDTETEEKILGHLRNIMKDRSTLLISHRVSTLKDADRILVLDNGKVAEEGSHETLLASGGLYAEMYERQQRENQKSKGA